VRNTFKIILTSTKKLMSDTFKRLQEIVGEQLAINPEKVKPNADFIKELGADSLDVIELVMAIEYEFDIDIEDQYASKITTVQDALNYIEKKLNQ
jgi:acyl carrier protein